MTDRQISSLLDLDPDLGRLLAGDRLTAAHRQLRVAVLALAAGPWDVDKLSGASPEHIGLLVLAGGRAGTGDRARHPRAQAPLADQIRAA